MASFDLPCSCCGNPNDVEMHHVKHIRKIKFSLIPRADTLQRMMSLRNRKQVPLCRTCPLNVHSKNNNRRLNLYNPITPFFERNLFDARCIDLERFIHKGSFDYESLPFIENLIEKG